MYLLDTNMCVDFLRNKRHEVYQCMNERGPALVKLPAIVVAELWCGAEHSRDVQRNRRILEVFLQSFEVVPFDEECVRKYGQLRAYLAAQGMLIGPNDLLIAATALANDAVLVTNNVDEFKRVPGLSIESWYEIDGV